MRKNARFEAGFEIVFPATKQPSKAHRPRQREETRACAYTDLDWCESSAHRLCLGPPAMRCERESCEHESWCRGSKSPVPQFTMSKRFCMPTQLFHC